MAKRQRNRNISWISATPTLIRVKGKPANSALCTRVRVEKCEKCGGAAQISRTVTSDEGVQRIQRLCIEHLTEANQPDILTLLEQLLDGTDINLQDMSTWDYEHKLTKPEPQALPTGNVDPHSGKPTFRAA